MQPLIKRDMDKQQMEQIAAAVREITLARAQISASITTLEAHFPTIKATGTLPAVQTINSLKRCLRSIDRIVKTTPQRIGAIQQLPKVGKLPQTEQ